MEEQCHGLNVRKIYLVVEYDYDNKYITAAYSDEAIAKDHAQELDLDVEEVDVLASAPAEIVDPTQRRQRAELRAKEKEEGRRRYEEQQKESERTHRYWVERNPEPHNGRLRLCSCEVFSAQESYFINKHGGCRYCGCWKASVVERLCGRDALLLEINRLNEHYRGVMKSRYGFPEEP